MERAAGVLWLEDPQATEPRYTGGKAAALARAREAGLPMLRGFVLTTAATQEVDTFGDVRRLGADVKAAWEQLSDGGQRPLVVRSSSTVEDQSDQSLAGQFESVLDVSGWEEFLDAVQTVLDSRRDAAAANPSVAPDHPIAVLVQPLLQSACGGVLFGVDPVTGREDRLVVAAASGGADRVVSGDARPTRYTLELDGTERGRDEGPDGADLSTDQLKALAGLAAAAAEHFGAAQDIEWAIGRDGGLWLLQSRPVTTTLAGVPTGPVLGPGPVAETFPDPLCPLEVDLWIPPLRRALEAAFRLAGSARPDQVEQSPVVLTLDGRVAVDLQLFGEHGTSDDRPRLIAVLDPRPRLRRARAAWRVGRLRAVAPKTARSELRTADQALSEVPALSSLSDRQLLALLDRAGQALAALHTQEVLIGLLVRVDAPRVTGAAAGLRVLTAARSTGLAEEMIVSRYPIVLALAAPKVKARVELPDHDLPALPTPPLTDLDGDDDIPVLREALRLRVRWMQELSARAAWALGERLAAGGLLPDPPAVREVPLEDLRALVLGTSVPWRRRQRLRRSSEPLPARFRMTTKGALVPVGGPHGGGGSGAGGGTARGRAWHGSGEPPDDAVLVVRTLNPALAALLSQVKAVVSETGSVLSHVAILARERGIPTVVGVADALERFPEGMRMRVNGTSGEVEEETA